MHALINIPVWPTVWHEIHQVNYMAYWVQSLVCKKFPVHRQENCSRSLISFSPVQIPVTIANYCQYTKEMQYVTGMLQHWPILCWRSSNKSCITCASQLLQNSRATSRASYSCRLSGSHDCSLRSWLCLSRLKNYSFDSSSGKLISSWKRAPNLERFEEADSTGDAALVTTSPAENRSMLKHSGNVLHFLVYWQ